MTVRSDDSIDRRLGFLQSDYGKPLPPLAYERPKFLTNNNNRTRPTPPPTSTVTMAGQRKPYLKASTIATSKKARQLMRQVSALGMEDPVFGTTEDGPKHPSNLFDDMSLGDVPLDMRDLVSIASDPTADGFEGIDEQEYIRTLNGVRRASLQCSRMDETEESISEEESIGVGHNASLPTEPFPLEWDEFNKTDSLQPHASSPKPSAQLLEKLNASIQSLPSLTLEDAMDGISSPPRSPHKEDSAKASFQHSRGSITSNTSRISSSEREESIARMAKRLGSHPANRKSRRGSGTSSQAACPLKYQAAPRVPQRQPTNEGSMLEVYAKTVAKMHKSATSAEFCPSALHRGDSIYQPIEKDNFSEWDYDKQRGVSALNSSLLVAQPENMHIPPTQPGLLPAKGGETICKSRAMPNIANLFPVGESGNSKRSRARRARAVKPSSASAECCESKEEEASGRHTKSGDTVSEMTLGTGWDTTTCASSARAVRTRNTNSVYSVRDIHKEI